MQQGKNQQQITPRHEDFAEWYQDVITAADLAEHSDVKGAMIIKPYGYAIWERMQRILDDKIKETGHQNAYFPLFIPKSYLSKEADHVEGFAKETAVVTHHRLMANPDGDGVVVDPTAKLTEELIVRPTSETAIHTAFARWISSYRDLPVLINQWANVVRWELRPRMFLRTTEFLWQEGHTAHATEAEAETEAKKMLQVYREFVVNYLAMPVIAGQKSESEKFAGALRTYTIEAMMQDGKALQAGTSHNLGQNFAQAFDVRFLDRENNLQYAWMTSWGVSTRMIGGLIMSHSDDKGLVLPPEIAPIQVVIVPINRDNEISPAVSEAVAAVKNTLVEHGVRVQVDEREFRSMGEKMYEWEKKGVPIRIEIGPRDLENETVVVARRDQIEKQSISVAGVGETISRLLAEIQQCLLSAAETRLKDRLTEVTDYAEFTRQIEAGGFFAATWCGDAVCEERIKAETKATIRAMPFDEQGAITGPCFACSTDGQHRVVLARAY